MKEAHEELVPFGRVIWQSETAKTYRCLICQSWVFTQYEGDESPTILCEGPLAGHRLRWVSGQLDVRKDDR